MKTVTLQRELIHTGNLILINAEYAYQESITMRTLSPANAITNKILLDNHVVKILASLMNKMNGWEQISAVSGWRSMREQEEIYIRSINDNGRVFTERFIALPGHSEHQTGLAIDLALRQEPIDFLRPNFPYWGICQTFRQTSISYGFIERYPYNKEDITGISHEPWHFRYVGVPHAEIITNNGWALEEYISFLKRHSHDKTPYLYNSKDVIAEVFYLEASKTAKTQFRIDDNIQYSVSGNNIDGFIVTKWRRHNGEQ